MYHDPRTGRLGTPPRDETTVMLEAKVFEALQPGNSHKCAEFWQQCLTDHIRNQHRKAKGMEPLIARWDRTAPERIVTVIEEGMAA